MTRRSHEETDAINERAMSAPDADRALKRMIRTLENQLIGSWQRVRELENIIEALKKDKQALIDKQNRDLNETRKNIQKWGLV